MQVGGYRPRFRPHRWSDLADHIFQFSLVYGGSIQITSRYHLPPAILDHGRTAFLRRSQRDSGPAGIFGRKWPDASRRHSFEVFAPLYIRAAQSSHLDYWVVACRYSCP